MSYQRCSEKVDSNRRSYRVFTPIPVSLRYVKSLQKMNHLQKIFCNQILGVHTNSVFVTFSLREIRTENEKTKFENIHIKIKYN